MKVIGLTGNIAGGKSSVAKMLEELGAKIIDADLIARMVVERNEPAWREIVEKFGREILNPDQTINRSKLGEIVFGDEEKRMELNRITHPRIIGRIKELVEEYKKQGVKVVVVEAALIVERGGLKPLISDLIVVTADEETQIKRLTERNRLSREEAIARIKSQMPISEKVKHATYVIDNSGTLEETRKQVEEVWGKINS
ncbi:MAG TPA: dephospho-CoA kinase [Thermodesulfobacteriota bacterium]|nr:dephospho-CoA kinase [Thermodesulfobacteriota bacterium]